SGMCPPPVETAVSTWPRGDRLPRIWARPVVPAPERDIRRRVPPDLLELLGGHPADGLGRDPHHQPACGHDLARRHHSARAYLGALLDDRAGEDDSADPDPRVVLDSAGVDDRAVPDRHAVADHARELGRDVEHGPVLDVRVPAEPDVVVLVSAEDGARPDARALLDRDVADHLGGGIDPGVRMDPWRPAGHLADHRVAGLRPAAGTPPWWRIALASGVPGSPSSVMIEKWSWPAMSMTSAARPRRRHAAA